MSGQSKTSEYRWIAVKEQLPSPVTKDGYYHHVLVSDWRGRLSVGRYTGGTVWLTPGLTCEPVYWTELPPPPDQPPRSVRFADGHCNKCGSTDSVSTIELLNRGNIRRDVCEECLSSKNNNSFVEWLDYTLSNDSN